MFVPGPSRARLTLLVVLGLSGCKQGPKEVEAADSVLVTFQAESLGVALDAPADSVQDAVSAAARRLQQAVRFELLAISPALHAIKVRPPRGGTTEHLLAALRMQPLVRRAEREGLSHPQ